jgi:hypothetical protein
VAAAPAGGATAAPPVLALVAPMPRGVASMPLAPGRSPDGVSGNCCIVWEEALYGIGERAV